LIDQNKSYISFPINAQLIKGNKDYILKPTDNPQLYVFDIWVECGYRGNSDFELLTPYSQKIDYYEYKSQLGTLGVSKGALIETTEPEVRIKFKRTGKTYGKPKEGIMIFKLDGSIEELPASFEDDALLSLE
jgi:hypothetical protein